MKELWAEYGWSEELEQAHQDAWAIRILTCPRARCRRRRTCFARMGCPAEKAHPVPKEMSIILFRMLRPYIRAVLKEREAGPEVAEAAMAERARERARRHKLAFERAREVLRREGRGR